MVWGGGALSLGVRTVPKGPIDRANKVSSPSLPPSRYSNTPRFERHPPLPHPPHPCLAARPPLLPQRARRWPGARRGLRGREPGARTSPHPSLSPSLPAAAGLWAGEVGLLPGSPAGCCSPRRGPAPPRPSLHRRPELLTGARWPQVPAAGRRRLGASTSPSRGPRHALGSSRLVTLSANLPPDFSCSHQPSPGRLPRCSGIVGGCWRGYTHPSYVGECPWA